MFTHEQGIFTVSWTAGTFVLWGVLWLCCRRARVVAAQPAYAAFNLANLLLVVALSYYGIVGMRNESMDRLLTVQDRMYLFDPTSEKIALLQIALQIFTTTASFIMNDPALLKPELLAHHVVTTVLMFVCLKPFVNSRGFMFFGLTELSSIPLNVTYLLKRFPDLRKANPTLDLLSKLSFSLAFLVLRVGFSSKFSWDLQCDLYQLYVTGTAHSVAAVVFVSLSNGFVSLLQLYWATLILKGGKKMLAGGGKPGGQAKDGKRQ